MVLFSPKDGNDKIQQQLMDIGVREQDDGQLFAHDACWKLICFNQIRDRISSLKLLPAIPRQQEGTEWVKG
jgi:hypothetical protein